MKFKISEKETILITEKKLIAILITHWTDWKLCIALDFKVSQMISVDVNVKLFFLPEFGRTSSLITNVRFYSIMQSFMTGEIARLIESFSTAFVMMALERGFTCANPIMSDGVDLLFETFLAVLRNAMEWSFSRMKSSMLSEVPLLSEALTA